MKTSFLKKISVFLFFFTIFFASEFNVVKADDCTGVVDVVFYIDTSGSMDIEWTTVCSNISSIVTGIESTGNTVNYSIYGLQLTKDCATSFIPEDDESWGPATSWVANNYTWTPGAIRIAVPMSDECPYEGDHPCDPSDANSITQAINDANANNIIVSPIISTAGTAYTHGANLATATGGTISNASTPAGIINAITNLIINEIGDTDGDGYLNIICGGDDCDDTESGIYPGVPCFNKCFGNTLKSGICQAGSGECLYDTTIMVCEDMGDGCKLDMCQEVVGGNDLCIADFSDSFCSGLVPCGRMFNNPATPWDDTNTCDLCFLLMLINKIINFLLTLAAAIAMLALVITGYLFITSAGNEERRTSAKRAFKMTLLGFIIIFMSWLMIDFLLSAWGYLDPLGGEWNVVCD